MASLRCSHERKANLKRRPVESTKNGASEEIRTLDINLGKVALYQLSYTRIQKCLIAKNTERDQGLN